MTCHAVCPSKSTELCTVCSNPLDRIVYISIYSREILFIANYLFITIIIV